MLQKKLTSTPIENLTNTAPSSWTEKLLLTPGQASSLNKLQKLYAAVNVPILLADTNGRILSVNTSFLKTFEFLTMEDLYGKHWTTFLADINKAAITMESMSIDSFAKELQVLTIQPDLLKKEDFETYLSIFVHDIKNTLSNLSGLGILALDGVSTEQEKTDFLKLIQFNREQGERQLHQLKTLSQMNNGSLPVTLEEIDIIPSIHKLIQFYRTMNSDRNLQIKILDIPPALTIKTHLTSLEQVLENILRNSCEALTRNSEITITIAETPYQINISISHPKVIPAEVQQRLFKEQISTKGRSRGLGTKSIKLLTENHLGGKVNFISAESIGTTFTVTLPKNKQN